MTYNTKMFLAYVVNTCIKHHITLNLDYSDDSDYCGGRFDGDSIQININISESDWLSVLVHEFSHLQQQIDNAKVWKGLNIKYCGVKRNVISIYNDWINSKRISKKIAKKCCKKIVQMELDCEKRSIKLIKKWHLSVNIPNYIKDANMVLYSYLCSLKYCVIGNPSNKITQSMPKKFLKNTQSYFDTFYKYDKLFFKFI